MTAAVGAGSSLERRRGRDAERKEREGDFGAFDDEDYAEAHNIKPIHFESEDGMAASVPIDVVLNRRSQVLLAFEMNEEELPPAHGFPVRVVVPGHVGVRNVKWVNRIILSDEESKGPWQRGMAYKGFGPSVSIVF